MEAGEEKVVIINAEYLETEKEEEEEDKNDEFTLLLLDSSNATTETEISVECELDTVLTFLNQLTSPEEKEKKKAAEEAPKYLILLPDGSVFNLAEEEAESKSERFNLPLKYYDAQIHSKMQSLLDVIKHNASLSVHLEKRYYPAPEDRLTADQMLAALKELEYLSNDGKNKGQRAFASAPIWRALETNLHLFWGVAPPSEIATVYTGLDHWREEGREENCKVFRNKVLNRARDLFKTAKKHPCCLSWAGRYLFNSISLWPCAIVQRTLQSNEYNNISDDE